MPWSIIKLLFIKPYSKKFKVNVKTDQEQLSPPNEE